MTRRVSKDEAAALPLVGWREWVGLPDLGVTWIKAKVDTGARSSSLHAVDLEYYTRGGAERVRFSVHPLQRSVEETIRADAKVLEYREVRSSSGHTSARPVIVTSLEIAGQSWPIELTLASRDAMGFRMLLGRESLRGRLLVDAGNSYYGDKPPKPRRRRARPRQRRRKSP